MSPNPSTRSVRSDSSDGRPCEPFDPESAVRDRYSRAATEREPALCCPVEFDESLLGVIPPEVLERDYGCGDPSRYAREGDVVLDLGSGGGKICFVAAQIVGPKGRVIGIDMNEEMLGLARRAEPLVAESLGFGNVEFRRGRIQDLALDVDLLDDWLRDHPVRSATDLAGLERRASEIRAQEPLVPDGAVDLVVSNCVLNLVREEDRAALFREIYRVLRSGGRLAVSDIVCDEPVPEALKADPELWSGCVSGAFTETGLLRALEEAGFHGIRIEQWSETPFAVVEGIEFRSVTVTARKGKDGPCLEAREAVVYRGPWRRVEDDDGHVLERGVRSAVCAKTFRLLTSEPYAGETLGIEPHTPVPESERQTYDCARTEPRHPRETKGLDYRETRQGGCGTGEGCC